MAFEFTHDSFDVDNEEVKSQFHVRDSIIFLIDGSPQMFDNNKFSKCLETYKDIIRCKCSSNKKDKIGLFLFGTKDTNCNVDNVMELQNFDTISVESLKKVMSIIKEDYKYKELATKSVHSLFNAVSHAFQVAHTIRSNAKTRNIIVICTTNDNPLVDAPVERRRIEHLVSTFKDADTQLRVVGLSETWNDNIFYKDLQIISGTYNIDDYKRTYLNDLEGNILKPARIIYSLPWKISSRVSIDVSIFNLISNTDYPSKVKLSKEDNHILEARNVLREQNVEDDEDDMDISEKRFITKDSVFYYKSYGDVDIHFKGEERKQLEIMGLEPSIEILAFKPISCDPLYHSKPVNFLTYSKTCTDENKAFFKALVNRCTVKKVMAICKVVTKSKLIVCMMIPSEDDGGFYMYKTPFKDSVRDLDHLLYRCLFEDETEVPLKNEGVAIFNTLIDLAKVDFDLKSFKNPKLQKIIAHIEALALDEKLAPLPPDSTLPPPIRTNIDTLKEDLRRVVGLRDAVANRRQPKSKSKQLAQEDPKVPKLDLKEAAESGGLDNYTIQHLKSFLKSVGVPVSGSKSDLIKKVKDYYKI